MKLQHRFFVSNTPAQGFWAKHVFKDVYSLVQLEKNLQATAFPNNPADLNGHDPLGMVLGDGWEAFCEIFLNTFGMHCDIRVSDLVVSPPGQQGYDFTFTHTQNQRIGTSNAKYVAPSTAWSTELRENELMRLERLLKASQNEAGVAVSDTDNIFVFTNAKNINWFTNDILLYKKVRCIGRKEITFLTKNNPAFWNMLRTTITEFNPHITF